MDASNSAPAAKYIAQFRSLLRENERLLTASAAINVNISEAYGRGAGDGTLGLTNERLIHVGSRLGNIEIERSGIRLANKKWIVLPGSSQLDLIVKKSGDSDVILSFYCGTGFCKDLLKVLS
jgi:hypothetical protein